MSQNRRRDASRRAGFLLPARFCIHPYGARVNTLPRGMEVA
jgi:hypothetical protein